MHAPHGRMLKLIRDCTLLLEGGRHIRRHRQGLKLNKVQLTRTGSEGRPAMLRNEVSALRWQR